MDVQPALIVSANQSPAAQKDMLARLTLASPWPMETADHAASLAGRMAGRFPAGSPQRASWIGRRRAARWDGAL